MKGSRTRLAPTPSGFLHVGNAVDFILAWLLARREGGEVHLRLDDGDAERLRPEYVQDVFDSLLWLGLDWDSGPRDSDEYRKRWALPASAGKGGAAHPAPSDPGALRAHRRSQALIRLAASGRVYACRCSRTDVRHALEASGGQVSQRYPGTCRRAGLDLSGPVAWRFAVQPGERAAFRAYGGESISLDVNAEMGDFIVRKRDGETAYHLDSVLEDERLGMDAIVRGSDLIGSTAAQILLAGALDCRRFAQARFFHHGLVVQDGGGKLSKSKGAPSLSAWRAAGKGPEALWVWVAEKLLGKSEALRWRASSAQGFGSAALRRALAAQFRPEPFLEESWPLSEFIDAPAVPDGARAER